MSSPLVVKVNPDTPPYQKVRGTLVSAETFGGIRVNFDNPEKAKLGLGVIKKQAEGIWTQVYMHYTEAKGGDFMYVVLMLLLQILVYLSGIDGGTFRIHCM